MLTTDCTLIFSLLIISGSLTWAQKSGLYSKQSACFFK